MGKEPSESRLDRIVNVWDSLPESFKDVLIGFAELGHKQPDLVEIMAGQMGPKKPVDYAKVILDNTKAQTSVIDLKGNIKFANGAAKDQLEKLTGRREVANISEFFEDAEYALSLYKDVVDSGEPKSFVQRTDVRGTDSGHDLFYFQLFPLQEFSDKPRKRHVVGQILLPLAEVLSMTEGYLNRVEDGEDIEYFISNIKPPPVREG